MIKRDLTKEATAMLARLKKGERVAVDDALLNVLEPMGAEENIFVLTEFNAQRRGIYDKYIAFIQMVGAQ